MEEPSAELEGMSPASLRARALERVRFEQSMGVEFLPRAAVYSMATPTSATVAPPARPAPVASAAAQMPRPVAPTPSVAPAAPVTPPLPAPVQRVAAAAPVPCTPPAEVPRAAGKPGAVLSPQEWGERWQALEIRALGCRACVLNTTRINVVFGCGNRKAKIVFVGEGPGQNEDEQGQPFVGNAGQLLTKIIEAMGLRRDEVYICNVVKCRPPGNRTPLPDEVAACSPFLLEQLELVAPKVIVALGSPAAKALLKTDVGITKLRGRWHAFNGIPLMPTYHPSFLLHQYTDENRRQVWEDMKQVVAKLKTV